MKKKASKSKAPARKGGARTPAKAKSAARPAARKRAAKPASTRPAIGPGRREQATIEAAKYTPSPVQSAGWPAFRYPLL